MKSSEIKTNLVEILSKSAPPPVMLQSSPGFGKTSIWFSSANEVHQLAKSKAKPIIFHPAVSDPTHFKGLPALVDGQATFLPYDNLRKLMDVQEKTCVMFDDLGQASASVQAAVMQLLLAREIDGVKISDHICFTTATNLRGDKAGVKQMLTPLLSRMILLKLEVDSEDWIDWAIDNDMPSELISFIRFRPKLLNTFDPKQSDSDGFTNFACPRTIATLGWLLKNGLNSRELIEGTVGQVFSLEFNAFLDLIKQVGDAPQKICSGENFDLGELKFETGVCFALACALSKQSDKHFKNIAAWSRENLQEEYQMMLIKDASRLHGPKSLIKQGGEAYSEWQIALDEWITSK